MDREYKLCWIGLILILQRNKRIIQKVIIGNNYHLCHPSQWIHGALTPQRKQRWPPSTWITSTFKSQDMFHVIWILHWTNWQINNKERIFDLDYIDGMEYKYKLKIYTAKMFRSLMCDLPQYFSWKIWSHFD